MARTLHLASAVFLLVYNSTIVGQSSLVEKRIEAIPRSALVTWHTPDLEEAQLGSQFVFFCLCAHMCEHPPTHPHCTQPHTLSPLPTHACLCIGCLWKDQKKLVTVATSGKGHGELGGWGRRDFLFHKTVEFCFKFIMIMEYPINAKECIEYVLQRWIQYTSPWTQYLT